MWRRAVAGTRWLCRLRQQRRRLRTACGRSLAPACSTISRGHTNRRNRSLRRQETRRSLPATTCYPPRSDLRAREDRDWSGLLDFVRTNDLDAITFTSSSTVRYMLDGLEQAGIGRDEARALLNATAVVCIGPITAATANEQGLRVDAVAQEYTTEGVVDALVAWFGQSPSQTKDQ